MDSLATHNQPMRVLIYEDNDELREVLMQLVNESLELSCCGAFADSRELDNQLSTSKPDAVIMDIDLPFRNGIETTRIIKETHPGLPVLILTVFEDDVKIFNAICAGADGYLLKNSRPERILDSLLELKRGGAPMSPMVARKVLETFKIAPPVSDKTYDLSSRELEILQLLTQGMNYKTIAAKCFISLDTVKFHAKNIYEKLQVHSKSEAVIVALKNKIV
jgi:DNA-binding NarL/FixJ family response regulator